MSSPWGDVEYHIETPAQFWSELEDTLKVPKRPTLEQLDASLLTYITLSAAYLDEYLNSEQLLDHALHMVLKSILFKFHSQRMIDLLLRQVRSREATPCENYVVMSALLCYGHHTPGLYRGLGKWRPVQQRLLNPLRPPDQRVGDVEGEVRLRVPVSNLLYEICRVQKLEDRDLDLFDEDLIDNMFEVVETTRGHEDETLNYSLIKLLIALNEQFMVATLTPAAHHPHETSGKEHHTGGHHHPKYGHAVPETPTEAKRQNRVLVVLMRRLGASKTFGENMIFMLNRAENNPEDLCMQLLILKILYLLFTTPGTSEYFYTNDLKVLVDVFIRALSDLPEESESLRHTYLRVLHPLLTSTQLRSTPYKRPHLLRVLRSLTSNPYGIRDITATTKRLVERCLGGEWCSEGSGKEGSGRPSNGGQQGSMSTMTDVAGALGVVAQVQGEEAVQADVEKSLGLSKSMDNLKLGTKPSDDHPPASTPHVRLLSDPSAPPASTPAASGKRQSSLPHRLSSHLAPQAGSFYSHGNSTAPHLTQLSPCSPTAVDHVSPSSAPDQPSPLAGAATGGTAQRRKPPAPPVNRATKGRMPAAVVAPDHDGHSARAQDVGRGGWQTFG